MFFLCLKMFPTAPLARKLLLCRAKAVNTDSALCSQQIQVLSNHKLLHQCNACNKQRRSLYAGNKLWHLQQSLSSLHHVTMQEDLGQPNLDQANLDQKDFQHFAQQHG